MEKDKNYDIIKSRYSKMQYQIIDKNGTIIAWIDTEKDSILVHSDYTIISGEDLDSTTIDGEIKPIIRAIVI